MGIPTPSDSTPRVLTTPWCRLLRWLSLTPMRPFLGLPTPDFGLPLVPLTSLALLLMVPLLLELTLLHPTLGIPTPSDSTPRVLTTPWCRLLRWLTLTPMRPVLGLPTPDFGFPPSVPLSLALL